MPQEKMGSMKRRMRPTKEEDEHHEATRRR